jgi:hypothetical protein
MPEISRNRARAIEWDCAQVLTRFFNAFDEWHYDDMARMFAPDGVWHRAGKALQGAAIMEALNARSRTQCVRHVVTNISIDVADDTSAGFTLYVTAYMHDSGEKSTSLPTIRAPYLLLTVPGRMVRVAEDWKIATMSMNRVFEFER